MPKTRIHIISFTFRDHQFLEQVRHAVSHEFGVAVKIREGHMDLTRHLDPTRKQYQADEILQQFHQHYSNGHKKVLGIFNVDLFIPILTFIYGQAYLNGDAGIASTYRLNPSRYGMPEDQQLLCTRTIKEVIHELGHTYGLIHCHHPGCVMNSSTYVEDIDQKDASFCSSCHSKLT